VITGQLSLCGHWSVVITVRWSLCGGHWSVVITVRWSLCGGHWSVVITMRWSLCGHWSVVISTHWSLCGRWWSELDSAFCTSIHIYPGSILSLLDPSGSHYHLTLDPAILWTPSNDTSRPIFSDRLNLMPPVPLYLRTLWRYTNAVIIIIIIIIITPTGSVTQASFVHTVCVCK